MERPLRAVLPVFALATAVALWAVPVSTRQRTTAGSDLFKTYCVACHGSDAKGTGPLADSLRKKPADLTALAANSNGTFPAEMVARIIDGRNPVNGHGGGDMPVWGEALLKAQQGGSEAAVKERIDSLVAYLRTVQKK
ncbi:MAG: cytochrome c [Acidobacteriota bacterium]|nr:cytochrome c [Acidobacteriota bacterium]